MAWRLAGIAVGLLAVAPAAAQAHVANLPTTFAGFAQSGACAISPAVEPDQVIEGELTKDQMGGYVQVPFQVPAGTTAVQVRYCFDRADAPTNSQVDHVLDLGLYDARSGSEWANADFRGWGGSSHPEVWISNEGYTSGAQVAGKTTRGFVAGPVEAGEWAAELGVAAVASQAEGDRDGRVRFRVEVKLHTDPAFADEPYQPAPYDSAPAGGPGWYAGDMHVHAEHSAFNDATMRETFDYAFGPANLDFVTLSDYVTTSAWGEVGRLQADYPGRLIARSAEVITYRGHLNNHGSATYVDYRTGPVREWVDSDGDGRVAPEELAERRGARPASAVFDDIHAAGGYTQINHPTIFPSKVPPFAIMCRGCSWEYDAEETDYSKVDALEVSTGPPGLQQQPKLGPNPFTPLAIQMYDEQVAAGHRIAAVGASDSHNAGRTPGGITQSPVGVATTVVYAPELSEEGLQQGIEAGHTYVKVFGNSGPDIRFSAREAGAPADTAIMGDELSGPAATFTARVMGAGPGSDATKFPPEYQLLVMKDGVPVRADRVGSSDFEVRFGDLGPGAYRLQLMRGTAVEVVSSPIHLVAP